MTRQHGADREAVRRWDPRNLEGARLAIYSRASEDSEDTETSVRAQEGFGEEWAGKQGITEITKYCDNDISASLYATKNRDDFERLWADIEAGKVDLVWAWKTNRFQRRLDVYVQFRELCRSRGIGWVIKRRIFDLNDPDDLRVLGNDAVNGEIYSLELSENVKLGHAMAAKLGKSHARCVYGYMRRYDRRRRYLGQFPDDEVLTATAEDGTQEEYTRAGVVREIITRCANREGPIGIAADLTRRGIPRPSGTPGPWHPYPVRNIALNRAYLGILVFKGEVITFDEPPWEPLIEPEIFHRAGNFLRDPARRTAKSNTAVHLLTNIARCAVCGEGMQAVPCHGYWVYRCRTANHSHIRKAALDEVVESLIVQYLSRPDVADYLKQAAREDATVAAARGEVERLRSELESWRRLSESGEADAVTATRAINGLREKITKKEKALDAASLPSVLRGKVGPNAAKTWKGLDLSTKRAVLRACCTFRVAPNGRGRVNVPVSDVVDWRWLIGPERGDVDDWPLTGHPPTMQEIIAAWFAEHGEVRTTAEVREFFATQQYRPTAKSLTLRLGRMVRDGILLRPERGHFVINRALKGVDLSQAS